MLGREGAEVDVEQLVAVKRQDRPFLLAARRSETKAAAAPERLRLSHRLDLSAETRKRFDERLLVSRPARDDHARDAAVDEPRDRVTGNGDARDRHERLWVSLRRLAQPLRLAAGEQERLHYSLVSNSGSAASGRTSVAEIFRPVPSYAKPRARTASGSRRLRPSTMSGCRIARRVSSLGNSSSCGHSVTITAAS